MSSERRGSGVNKNQLNQARRPRNHANIEPKQQHTPGSPPLPTTSSKPNRTFFKKRRQMSHSTDQSDSDGTIELSPMIKQCSATSAMCRFSFSGENICNNRQRSVSLTSNQPQQTDPSIYDDYSDDGDHHNDSNSIYSDHSDRRRRSFSALAMPTRKRRLNDQDDHWI